MERQKKYIASCSFGKDSLATILLAIEHGDPLDDVCYVEIMYDKKRDISAEHEEHREFIYQTAIPKLEKMGVHVTVVRPEYDYLDIFFKKRKKGPYTGKCYGFPLAGMCAISKECKTRAIKAYNREIKKAGFQPIHYVGIAIDELKRLESLHNKGNGDISLLKKYNIAEAMATEICKAADLYSPLYKFTKRGGLLVLP